MLNNLNQVRITDKNKILGEGAYSEVLKVQYQEDQKLYALKQIDIQHLSKEDCNNLKNEMKLHKSLDHPHIIKFYDALQIKHMVYFLLEYACNGCLFFYIHPKKGLPERLALRFLYQTSLAVQYIHQNSCLHRDIKPENILLDEDFNVKLCDFGWSCFLDNKKPRKSICGTYEYMPPEVLKKNAQTEKVDIWCIGIMFYEMLHGKTPFDAEGLEEIRDQLEQKQIMVKESISTDSKNLLRNLLRKNESERYSIEQVLNDQAFDEVKKTLNQQINPEDFSILMEYYLVNVRSQKRHLPESIERSMKKQEEEENTINKNLIKEIKESFFQTANHVEGFFDNLPYVKNSVQATQNFFEASNRNIPAQTFAEEQKNQQSNRKIEYVQSVQDNVNSFKEERIDNQNPSFNRVNSVHQFQVQKTNQIDFDKLYQNIQKESFNKKQNISNDKNFQNQKTYNSSENDNKKFDHKRTFQSDNLQNDSFKKKDNQSFLQNNSQLNESYQQSKSQKPNPSNFQNYIPNNYIRNNSNNSKNKNQQNKYIIQFNSTRKTNNPPILPLRRDTNQIQQQTTLNENNLLDKYPQKQIRAQNQSFYSQYNTNINNMSFQQQNKQYQEQSPQIKKKTQKVSLPNVQIQSQNSPDFIRRINQGYSKSFFSSSAQFQPFNRGFQEPKTEINQRISNFQDQERKNSFYVQKDMSTIREEDNNTAQNYKSMNFVNASYKSITNPNIQQFQQNNTLQNNKIETQNEQKKSVPLKNTTIQQQKINNIQIAQPTHKYVMNNGILQKMELTEQDFKEHGPKLAKNYSGYLYQKQLRSLSSDITKTKTIAPNSNKIQNFNLDLNIGKLVQDNKNYQQQRSLTNRESFSKDLTLFQNQNFRGNITIIKKQTIDQ